MSASIQLKPPSRAATDKQRRKAVAADRKRQAAAAARLRDEARDELLAPKIQRLPILGRDGEVIKNARLERDGISFRVSSPIRRMVALSKGKEAPLLRKPHADAADRLRMAYEECSGGVSWGVSNYEQRASGTPQTGVIAAAVLRGVHRQMAAHTEIEAARTHLGPLWGAVFSVAISGIDISAWAEAVGMRAPVAVGYLVGGLDILVRFYAGPETSGRIRSVAIDGLAPAAE
jgi:hypothetical protein